VAKSDRSWQTLVGRNDNGPLQGADRTSVTSAWLSRAADFGVVVLNQMPAAGRPDSVRRMLPSDGAMRARVAEAGLLLDGVQTFGASYARTLSDWRARFQNAWPRLRTMNFEERFRREWEYYLSCCEAGFLDVGMYRPRRPV
jgi:mycolic acid cyclopropane synthetase